MAYIVDANGKKQAVRPPQPRPQPRPKPQQRQPPVQENYSDKGKCSSWLKWVLIALAAGAIMALAFWWFKSRSGDVQERYEKTEDIEMPGSPNVSNAEGRFGFNFY